MAKPAWTVAQVTVQLQTVGVGDWIDCAGVDDEPLWMEVTLVQRDENDSLVVWGIVPDHGTEMVTGSDEHLVLAQARGWRNG